MNKAFSLIMRRATAYSVLIIIGGISALYSIFKSSFAEVHLFVPGPNFPIFIGEIVMAICFFLYGWRFFFDLSLPRPLRAGVTIYILWIIWKSVFGYFESGAFAFRNAALFYYPFISMIVFLAIRDLSLTDQAIASADKKKFIRQKLLGVVFFVILLTFAFLEAGVYVGYIAVVFFVIFLPNIGSLWIRWIFLTIAIAFVLKGRVFYCQVRSDLVGLSSAVLFTAIFFFPFLSRKIRKNKWMGMAVGVILVSLIFAFADRNAVRSLFNIAEVKKLYMKYENKIDSEKNAYISIPIEARAYNPDTPLPKTIGSIKLSAEQPKEDQLKNDAPRPLTTAYNNILFRYFIWRDMISDLVHKKAFFGFSFGRPQRSRSVEILRWAHDDWRRDGWIAPHNSWLHIIYRGGVIGFAAIGVFLWFVVLCIRDFVRLRSVEGGVLVSTVIFGMVVANFSVFLELPYTAFPFWVCVGIVAFYRWQTMDRI